MNCKTLILSAILALAAHGATAAAATSVPQRPATDAASMKQCFINVPQTAKPCVLWMWMSGYVTKEGITKDLEQLKAKGFEGVEIFNIGRHMYDEGKNIMFTPDWEELMGHAISEAQRLGIDMTIVIGPGWSCMGGPWVTPEESMKEIVWSKLDITADGSGTHRIPRPEERMGFYRDIATFAIPARKPSPAVLHAASVKTWGDGLLQDMDGITSCDIIGEDEIIDLSDRLVEDELRWEAPKGEWTILRFGYTTTGKTNNASRALEKGLEIDKLNSELIEREFYRGVPGHVLDLEKRLGANCIESIAIDSWEAGVQSWTEGFDERFEQMRNYSLKGFLPVFAGYVVGSVEKTRGFLWDFRYVLAQMFYRNWVATIRGLSAKSGKTIAVEPYRNGIFNSFDYGVMADYPQSEFWKGGHNDFQIKIAASVTHAKGTVINKCESFTTNFYNGGWRCHPWQLKSRGDKSFALGVNKVYFHTFAHDPFPDNVKPGMSMGKWGTMMSRKQTWWPMVTAYTDYLSRSQYMLRQGVFQADILFVENEHLPKPNFQPDNEYTKRCPKGYDFDVVSADYFIDNATVVDGKIVLPGGTRYSLLVLPRTQYLTGRFIRRIDEVVRQGVYAIGCSEYSVSPSLMERNGDPLTVGKIAGGLRTSAPATYFPDGDISAVLETIGLKKDFDYSAVPDDAEIMYQHRKTEDADIFYVVNTTPKRLRLDCRFRGMNWSRPEIWNPVTGETVTSGIFRFDDGAMTVPLEMDKWESFFVVFNHSAAPGSSFYTSLSDPATPAQSDRELELTINKVLSGPIFGPGPQNVDVTDEIRSKVKDNTLHLDKLSTGMIMHYDVNGEENYLFRVAQATVDVASGKSEANPLGAGLRSISGRLYLMASKGGEFILRDTLGGSRTVRVPDAGYECPVKGPWTLDFVDKIQMSDVLVLNELEDLSGSKDERVKYYSGIILYSTTVRVSQSFLKRGEKFELCFDKVANMAAVKVNGVPCGHVWARPFRVDITRQLKSGDNVIEVEVANSWMNRLIGDERYPVEVMQNGEFAVNEPMPSWALSGELDKRPQKERLSFTVNRFHNADDPLPVSGITGKVWIRKSVLIPLD